MAGCRDSLASVRLIGEERRWNWGGLATGAWKRGALLLKRMVARESVCLRRLAGGRRREIVRFGRVTLKRPRGTRETGLPKTVAVSLVEVVEATPPPGAEPILWRLLTTHEVTDPAMAWRVIGWYRGRWMIEQLFRTLKQHGLQLENSQLETADGLLKLTAIAARAACTTL